MELAGLGQSPWYDNIDRRLIKNGELKKFFEKGILGVTSNPTIFEKAVNGSDIYDSAIKKLYDEGRTASEICDILTIEDVSEAAGLLRDRYDVSNHLDGYVSIEVPPELAYDAERTVRAALEIFGKINKPNIMIKVPGTTEGCLAVRELIRYGVNVNLTLLFSLAHYESSAAAYINGLRDRIKDGKDVRNIFSVASVFVSRIDTKLDRIFEEKKAEGLKGKIAVANSKMIYQKFKDLFKSTDFGKLKQKGANLQRVLWASTSTKNPAYPDLKYVEGLIGPDTINTMPPDTMNAFLDHGKACFEVEENLGEARAALARLTAFGIDLEKICQEIQDAGVKAFQNSFSKLINAIEEKK
ncbi:MAG: transaldolase [Candidatus Omnitrophica bacterium]|nr:transaldolase [Candidatus Omnitrophota bacterium]